MQDKTKIAIRVFLSTIGELAGTHSKEYRTPQAALETPPGTGLVY
jgi:hypothetical protein